MRRRWHYYMAFGVASALMFTSCNDNEALEGVSQGHDSRIISLSGEIDQVAVTRVNDNGFCDGDIMGVYVVDYNGNTPGTLATSGNRGTNVPHTFEGRPHPCRHLRLLSICLAGGCKRICI